MMLGRKGQYRQWETGVRSNVLPGFGVGQLIDRVGDCLGRDVIGQAWPALEDLRVA